MTKIQTSPDLVKTSFRLEVEDDWPPVAIENLWLEKTVDGYQVRNIPFFIDGLAFKDIIEISSLDSDMYRIKRIVRRSGNSTLLMLIKDDSVKSEVLEIIKNRGCRYEHGVLEGYYAINVPLELSVDELENILVRFLSAKSILLDYPFVYEKND